ncbi:MAG TPA: glycosyltransferase [Gaiellales bacterium]|nr:glycosyltransferase [Gaiellales bacterium]
MGTDYHPFDRLCGWVDRWLADGGADRVRCFVQTGTSTPPAHAEHGQYLGHAQMEAMMREAAVIVCHGGPGTIMLAATMGKRPIVVPRRKSAGEHVDDHQHAFTRRIAADGAIILAQTEQDFRLYLSGVLRANGADPVPPRTTDPADAVRRFEQLVDGLLWPAKAPRRPRPSRGGVPRPFRWKA